MNSAQLASFGRGAAYFAYNIPPVAFVGGLIRVVMAVYHLAKKYFDVNATPAKSGISAVIEAFCGRVSENVETAHPQALKKMWKEQLYRGLIEMIPIVGSAFLSYQDNKVEFIDQRPSIFGLIEMANLVDACWHD